MPYYIYKIFEFPIKRVQKIEQHEIYKQGAERRKLLGKELALTEQCNVKLIFAENEFQAEELLMEVREPLPELGDD